MKRFAALLFAASIAACGGEPTAQQADAEIRNSATASATSPAPNAEIEAIAADFVHLGLELGTYDEAYVDAFHGPAEWRAAAVAAPRPLVELKDAAETLIARIDDASAGATDPRKQLLRMQIVAAHTRIRMAGGEKFSFDEETRLLYDAVAPQYDIAKFDAALARVEALAPGEGPLWRRVDDFRDSLAVPRDRLEAVFDAAIAECRKRTLAHYDLPKDEGFTVAYVVDKPWSGYNWYQGGHTSRIEINVDFSVIIDRAVDLGCHEGYPGHHTWNVLVERDFVGSRGWIEYSLYPLFSPQSLIGEGSANYGIELAFPGDDRIAFERDVLFPLAGLDPSQADRLAALNEATRELSHARNHIAREYLDGRAGREEAIDMLQRYGLQSRERAEKGLSFIETYRGYVINYNLGRDLVAAHIEAAGEDRWAAFERLLTTPVSASGLSVAAEGGR